MRRLVPCSTCQRHVFPQETSCPHCGRPSPAAAALAALAVTAGLALAACERPAGDVYGPPPVDPSRRTPAADAPAEAPSETSTGEPAPSATGAPAPSDTATSAPAPSAPATAPTTTAAPQPVRVPSKVYGPPPRKPSQRDPL